VIIRPEDVLVGDRDTAAAGANVFDARVDLATFTGGRSTCELIAGNMRVVAELQGLRRLVQGETVKVGVLAERIRAFARSKDTASQLAALEAV
jgi:hypothetical protein